MNRFKPTDWKAKLPGKAEQGHDRDKGMSIGSAIIAVLANAEYIPADVLQGQIVGHWDHLRQHYDERTATDIFVAAVASSCIGAGNTDALVKAFGDSPELKAMQPLIDQFRNGGAA